MARDAAGSSTPSRALRASASASCRFVRIVNRRCYRDTVPMAKHSAEAQSIPGTVIFDGTEAQKGYALNKMCYSVNRAENRKQFVRDEEAYCRAYGLTAEQCDAVRRRDVLALVHGGGNVYYLAKLAGIFGLGVQDIGAQQTGVTVEEFRARLTAAGA
jgi:protocatechuate 4,5-dioxygenase alpha chain